MSSIVWAQPTPNKAAKEAYDQGSKAFDEGDFATAARQYARADALAPHPIALRWAIVASVRAGDPVLAMTLVDRADERKPDASLDKAVTEAREAFASRVASLAVRCPPRVSCQARVDGSEVRTGDRVYYLPGTHRVEIDAKGTVTDRWIDLAGGQSSEVIGDAPPPPPAPRARPAPRKPIEPEPEGGSPAWFGVTLGITAVLGGVTIWSGVDTLQRHDDYLAAPTPDGYDDGRDAQLRTNILLGATSAAAVATFFVGLFAVQWSSETKTAKR